MSSIRRGRSWVGRELRRRTYVLRRERFVRRRMRGPRPVIVYTVGKTGSTAVIAAIRAAGGDAIQVHWVTRLREVERTWRRQRPYDTSTNLWNSHYLRRLLAEPGPERLEVVTIVRDPLARSISGIFQIGERYGLFTPDTPATAGEVERLTAGWLEHGYHRTDWIETELVPTIGVDVYQQPFDHAAGWQLVDGERARVLVLRQESLDRAHEGLSALLGREVPPVARVHDSSAKAYAALYERFLDEVRIPRGMVDEVFASRMVRHFYTEDEVDEMRRRWSPHIAESVRDQAE